MGLDATPMEGLDRAAYKQILKQYGYAPLFAVTVGYANTNDWARPDAMPKTRSALDDVIDTI